MHPSEWSKLDAGPEGWVRPLGFQESKYNENYHAEQGGGGGLRNKDIFSRERVVPFRGVTTAPLSASSSSSSSSSSGWPGQDKGRGALGGAFSVSKPFRKVGF
jgi:hypothetical protein